MLQLVPQQPGSQLRSLQVQGMWSVPSATSAAAAAVVSTAAHGTLWSAGPAAAASSATASVTAATPISTRAVHERH